MDAQRMVDATTCHRLAVALTFDPSADDSERWLACIGFDCYGAGPTADAALDDAMNREALGPEPLPVPDDECLPFTDEPNADDLDGSDAGDWYDDPRALGDLPAFSGKH